MSYSDATSVTSLLRTPGTGGNSLQQMIASASPQVQVVDWIFKKVTGISLVETIVAPLMGDWARIAANGEAWRSIASSLEAISQNLDRNVDELQNHWQGAASDSFGNHVRSVWADAMKSQAGLARLLGEGFQTVSQQSQQLGQEVMKQLETLVNKLIQAIATIWVPFAGWARAVELVWEAFKVFQEIMKIINAIKGIIDAAKALFNAVSQIKSAIEAIPDVRNAGDAVQIMERLNAGLQGASRAVHQVDVSIDQARGALSQPEATQPAGSQPAGSQPGGTR
jgi:hypothetical protein